MRWDALMQPPLLRRIRALRWDSSIRGQQQSRLSVTKRLVSSCGDGAGAGEGVNVSCERTLEEKACGCWKVRMGALSQMRRSRSGQFPCGRGWLARARAAVIRSTSRLCCVDEVVLMGN
jgi:hypothetical protein